jgi:hypothetical protein
MLPKNSVVDFGCFLTVASSFIISVSTAENSRFVIFHFLLLSFYTTFLFTKNIYNEKITIPFNGGIDAAILQQ